MKPSYLSIVSLTLAGLLASCGSQTFQNRSKDNSETSAPVAKPVEPKKEDAAKAAASAPYALVTKMDVANLSKAQKIEFAVFQEKTDLSTKEKMDAAFVSAKKIVLTRENKKWVLSSSTLSTSSKTSEVISSNPSYDQYGQPIQQYSPQYGYAPGYGTGYGSGFGTGYLPAYPGYPSTTGYNGSNPGYANPGYAVPGYPTPAYGQGYGQQSYGYGSSGYGVGYGYGYGTDQNTGYGMPFLGPVLGWLNDASFTAVNVAQAIYTIQCMFQSNSPHYNNNGWNVPYYPQQPIAYGNGVYQPYAPGGQPIAYNQSPYYTNPSQPNYQWPQYPGYQPVPAPTYQPTPATTYPPATTPNTNY